MNLKASILGTSIFTTALFSGMAWADTAVLGPTSYDEDGRSAYIEIHHPGEGQVFENGAWTNVGEVDLGFQGGWESNLNGTQFENYLGFAPYHERGDAGSYQHMEGRYSFVNESGYPSIDSEYYLDENGALIFAYYYTENEDGSSQFFWYETESWGGAEGYERIFVDVDGNDVTDNSAFDTEALLSTIRSNFPLTGYGIFDFQNTWINYEDGNSIALSELLTVDTFGTYFSSFNNGNWEDGGVVWSSASQIASVSLAYNLSAASSSDVPEPSILGLLAVGALSGFAFNRRRRHG
jgi:hypothetical protein